MYKSKIVSEQKAATAELIVNEEEFYYIAMPYSADKYCGDKKGKSTAEVGKTKTVRTNRLIRIEVYFLDWDLFVLYMIVSSE